MKNMKIQLFSAQGVPYKVREHSFRGQMLTHSTPPSLVPRPLFLAFKATGRQHEVNPKRNCLTV